MSTQESTVVHIGSTADLESLSERLPLLANEHILVSVQEDSSVLITAAEFYRLVVQARTSNVTLAISTDDQLRRELARMLGWTVVDQPREVPESDSPPTSDQADPEPANGSDPPDEPAESHTTADLATYVPPAFRSNGATEKTAAIPTVQAAAAPRPSGHRPPAAQPQARPPARTDQPRPRRAASASDRASSPWAEPEGATKAAPRRRRWFLITGAIAAPLVVLGVVAWLLFYLLPTATVTLTPREHTIAADVVYGVGIGDAKYDITIPPVPVTHTVTFDRTIPATGERFEPDAAAAGTVMLTNSSTSPIVVPKGTAMIGKNGMSYFTQADVTVPKADPFGTLALGSATVNVAAAKPGLDGNADAGAVIGQLDSGVFYNNREAIAGGTRKRILVISPADTEALKVAAEDDLKSRAQPEFEKSVDPALTLIPSSLKVEDPKLQFSKEAGTDATEVAVHGTMTVSAQGFDPKKLNEQAKEEVAKRLASEANGNEIMLGDSIKMTDPVALSGGTSFAIHTEGRVRAVITDEERQALAEQLVGKNLDRANAIVDQMGDVAQHQIEVRPTWLPKRMPEILKRIEVSVVTEDRGAARP